MSDIPPPLRPEPPPEPEDTLFIPFILADAPRLQLDFLSRHKALPEAHREAIRKWLIRYNTKLLKWLHDNYGPEAVHAADALARAAAAQMMHYQKEAQEKVERDLFAHLEEEMGKDENG